MWIFDIFMGIIELIIEGCGAFAPRTSVWYWLMVALILCVVIGLGIYFWGVW